MLNRRNYVSLSSRTIRKRIEKIEEKVSSKPEEDIVLVLSFGSSDELHGKYGYRKFHIYSQEREACSEEEELEYLREAYDRIPLETRNRVEYWSCFEKFQEYSRCKCSLHHNGSEMLFEGFEKKD